MKKWKSNCITLLACLIFQRTCPGCAHCAGCNSTQNLSQVFRNDHHGGDINFLWNKEGTNAVEHYNISARFLVIVNGQLRGGPIAWDSLFRNLIQPVRADLALLGPPLRYYRPMQSKEMAGFQSIGVSNESLRGITHLRNHAKYLWDVSEPHDWGDVISNVSSNKTNWRTVLCDQLVRKRSRGTQFLGGVSNCHSGSALAYRGIAFSKIMELRGEEFGGVTDRFSIFHSSMAEVVFGVTADIVTNYTWWYEILIPRRLCNLESVLLLYFTSRRHVIIQKFDHIAFTIRRIPEDPTRWAKGHPHPNLNSTYEGIIAKYPGEVEEATKTCDPWNQLKYFNAKKAFHTTASTDGLPLS